MNQLNKFKLQSLNGSFQDVPKSSILPRKARGNCNGVAVFEAHKGHHSEEFIVPHAPKARNFSFQLDSLKRATIYESTPEGLNPNYEDELAKYNEAAKKHGEKLAEYERLMVIWKEEQELEEYKKLKADKKRLDELEKKFGGK